MLYTLSAARLYALYLLLNDMFGKELSEDNKFKCTNNIRLYFLMLKCRICIQEFNKMLNKYFINNNLSKPDIKLYIII